MIKEITVKYELDKDYYHDEVIHVLQSLDVSAFISVIHQVREFLIKLEDKDGYTEEQKNVIEEIKKEVLRLTNELMLYR